MFLEATVTDFNQTISVFIPNTLEWTIDLFAAT